MAGANLDPDADLLTAAMAGDRDAFGALLRRHYDRIHGLAWQLMGSRADADDIAQDVCCILVEKIASFRGEAKFSTWLCGIVFNACRDLRRRRHSFSGSWIDVLEECLVSPEIQLPSRTGSIVIPDDVGGGELTIVSLSPVVGNKTGSDDGLTHLRY